jgi:hypothetical protein
MRNRMGRRGAILLSVCAGVALALTGAHVAQAGLQWSHRVGLGKLLTTSGGGQVFGYDIDRSGNFGMLATANNIQEFDQTTGAVLKVFPARTPQNTTYGFNGIFNKDAGLVVRYVEPRGSLNAIRHYDMVGPFTAGGFTGAWTPPVRDIDIQTAGSQDQSKTVVLAFERGPQRNGIDLFSSNVAANTFSQVFRLDPNTFCECFGLQLGAFLAANQAVIALSPDGGTVGGRAPINYVIDLTTGHISQFNGFNNGPFHAGFVNGMAMDPATGVEATTTELNAQVEFYNVATHTGITAVQLPCTGSADQLNSGAGIGFDPVNKLFLVSDPAYACDNGQDGAVVVYDEAGNLVESIPGFKFFIAEPGAVVNPNTRVGWMFGPGFGNLQQFFY